MITLAESGQQVVRLKSGDPMIFGRAGEEIEVPSPRWSFLRSRARRDLRAGSRRICRIP